MQEGLVSPPWMSRSCRGELVTWLWLDKTKRIQIKAISRVLAPSAVESRPTHTCTHYAIYRNVHAHTVLHSYCNTCIFSTFSLTKIYTLLYTFMPHEVSPFFSWHIHTCTVDRLMHSDAVDYWFVVFGATEWCCYAISLKLKYCLSTYLIYFMQKMFKWLTP